MHYHILITSTLLSVTLAAITESLLTPTSFKHKSNNLTCPETYGGGSITRGNLESSSFCYDPTLGESCCILDSGFCTSGGFCADIKGYCCHNDEYSETCTEELGFIRYALVASTAGLAISSTLPCGANLTLSTLHSASAAIKVTSITTTLIATSTVSLALAEISGPKNGSRRPDRGTVPGNASSTSKGGSSQPSLREGEGEIGLVIGNRYCSLCGTRMKQRLLLGGEKNEFRSISLRI